MRAKGLQIALIAGCIGVASAADEADLSYEEEFWLWLEEFMDEQGDVLDPIDFVQAAAVTTSAPPSDASQVAVATEVE